MLSKSKLLPVLIAVFVLALTPVLAYADAGPKGKFTQEQAEDLYQKALDVAEDEDIEISSHGSLISWVAKSVKDSSSALMGALDDLSFWDDYDNLNHGQIVSAIAKSKAEANDDGDDEEETSQQGRGHAWGKDKNADKHDDANSQNADEDDDEDEDEDGDEDDDSESSAAKTHGKSELNKQKGAKK